MNKDLPAIDKCNKDQLRMKIIIVLKIFGFMQSNDVENIELGSLNFAIHTSKKRSLKRKEDNLSNSCKNKMTTQTDAHGG